MINFNDVNSPATALAPDRWLGRLLRAPLRLIPKGAVLPILQGPGRGLRWVVGAYNHGCWLGSYEFEKQLVLPRVVSPGDVVYDLGAHVGYFTIIFSRLVGQTGAVYAFEPFPENFRYLQRHVALNRCTNVIPIQAGVAAESGTATFAAGTHSATGGRRAGGGSEVPVYTLEDYITAHGLRPPTLLKVDIEGEEATVVPTLLPLAHRHGATFLISTHTDAITAGLTRLLAEHCYRLTPLQWATRPATRTLENATLVLAEP